MKVHTLWITRKSDREFNPELVNAWDEYSVEGNYEGWQKSCKDALSKVGDDLSDSRVAVLNVEDISLGRIFRDVEIDVSVL